ncbi:uncharacterized protein EAE98_002831 [Botrytis deweyae]|uniref:glutathione-specific gamma-glutamylcyclotransferase n=1 Tax=Botrytis deweyae TaxID=2478750 RepID=A0ABQ7IUU8_9HELO|nr:uncharacterized protein EAE98_002831 [Botrytis deweyae]KAF7934786.1 hypothetical protein EAE98_002831 [Botrytis deweyae]
MGDTSLAPSPSTTTTTTTNPENEFWIFGYGSLIWKPPPHFDRRIPGYVTGYIRRFWQASEDHRGTPSSPGRVVTLISHSHWLTLSDPHSLPPSSSPKTWGVAYHVPSSHVAQVREYLDIREINGYTIHYTEFYPAASSSSSSSSTETQQQQQQQQQQQPIQTLLYIGTPSNPQFTGPQDPQELAEHIFRSEGPSGLNRDYLLSLDVALDELSPESGDDHIKDLANRVRKIAERQGDVEAEASHTEHIDHELKKVKSTDEQEETEK